MKAIFGRYFYFESNYRYNMYISDVAEWKHSCYRGKDKPGTSRGTNNSGEERTELGTGYAWVQAMGKIDGKCSSASVDLAPSQIILITFQIFVHSTKRIAYRLM